MLLNGAFGPRHRTATMSAVSAAASTMSHEETLVFITEAGAALAATQAAAMQRVYDRELAETVRVPLINRIAAELETLERKSPSTRRVYAADCKRFKEFCDAAQTSVRPASAEVVCHFLLEQADNGASPATINRLRAAISLAHRAAHCFDPTDDILVRATVQHISRTAKGGKSQTRTAAQESSPEDAPDSAANLTSNEPKGQ
jgi:integrase family protein with SAM-like domain